ncbi:MAG: hypothetical protein VKJ05_03370, partial [Synechococcaceae cyanobacterium]|nr:hypothetical protein [Synechococcaceae cyanobacterium]
MPPVVGTNGSDVITTVFTSIGVSGTPTAADDQINAGAGDDFISGGNGNDLIDGGTGIDTVAYSDATGAVRVSLGTGTVTGAAGNDILISIENAIGSNFADTFLGNSASNSFRGDAGNDIFIGSAGNDTIDGGTGSDTANYSDLGVVVQLAARGSLSKGTLGTDNLIGIETIIGSTLSGDSIDLSGASTAPATGSVVNLTTGAVTVNGTSPLPLSFSVSQFEDVIGSG